MIGAFVVAEAVRPFARHLLVEALDFPVRAWPVGLGGEVADATFGEQLAQRAIADIAEAVVRG